MFRAGFASAHRSATSRLAYRMRAALGFTILAAKYRLRGHGHEQEQHSDHDAQGLPLARGRNVEPRLTG